MMLGTDVMAMDPANLWILSLAFVIAFLLAFSVGANDVSNSFGTSVGSRVLTVTQACILATFFEVAGSTLLGYKVCDFFRKEAYNVSLFENSYKELMIGSLSSLIGSAAWNMIATALKMPISGTHSIVGATIGFSVVLKGWGAVNWWRIAKIVASWFASPLLSGAISSLIYLLISKTIIRKAAPLKYGLKALPLFYGATVLINVASVLIDGPEVLGLNNLPWYVGLLIALVIAAGVICVVALILVPNLKRQILGEVVTAIANKNSNGHNSARPKPPQRMVTTSLTKTRPGIEIISAIGGRGRGDEKVGFDNVAFKPDTQSGDVEINEAPKELALDPSRLAADKTTDEAATDKATDTAAVDTRSTTTAPIATTTTITNVIRPQIVPKPAHLLKRQEAKDESGGQLEEIDLSQPGRVAKKSSLDIESCPMPAANNKTRASTSAGGDGGGHKSPSGRPDMIRGERLEVFRLFSSLQILTACFASFAHGTNDVSNAVAPLIPIWNIFTSGKEDIEKQTEVFILAFGSIGICTGLWAWGRAVMSTVGDGLAQLTPSKGFAIELGAAISVLTATKIGLPISTTHCKVGSVVIVGLVSSKYCSQDNLLDMTEEEQVMESKKKAVDWKLFGNIAVTWILTVPAAAVASAGVTAVLKWLIL